MKSSIKIIKFTNLHTIGERRDNVMSKMVQQIQYTLSY